MCNEETGYAQAVRETQVAAGALGVQLHYLDVLDPKDIETRFREATKRGIDAVLAINSPVLNSRRPQLADLAVKSRLPVAYGMTYYAESGGLMTYGSSISGAYRQASLYVGRILKGEKSANLPVMRSTRFEFVINLKTAKTLGLEFHPQLLATADEVIE